jgi:tetratricopeptide (TPR) repeat protein
MVVSLALNSWLARLAILLVISSGCWALARIGHRQYFINALNEQGAQADLETLAEAVQRFPHSARLQAQWAAASLTQANDFEGSLSLAETAAQQAVQLSPNNADYHLLLAATQSISGDLAARETHLRRAVTLAPHYPQVHWQLANLLVRAGKLEESLDEFRQVADTRPALLPTAFDLLWEASGGDANVLVNAAGRLPRNRMALANYLLQQKRADDAAQVYRQIEVSARTSAPETNEFLNRLINAGQPDIARRLWNETVGAEGGLANTGETLISNRSFETDTPTQLAHFDWQLKRSNFASPKIEKTEAGTAHSGQRALRLDFAGRDTTKLTDEVRQLLVLEPAITYRFSCYVKTAQFSAPEGPRWVLLNSANNQIVAATNRVNPAQSEWQLLTADFTTPTQSKTFWLALQRIPQFSYDEPTKGTLWFDDCSLQVASLAKH